MPPIELAVLTSAATMLGYEAVKGAAGEAGKDAWNKVKSLFGWKEAPAPQSIAREIAERLSADRALAAQVADTVAGAPSSFSAQMIGGINIGQINAEKQFTIGRVDRMDVR